MLRDLCADGIVGQADGQQDLCGRLSVDQCLLMQHLRDLLGVDIELLDWGVVPLGMWLFLFHTCSLPQGTLLGVAARGGSVLLFDLD